MKRLICTMGIVALMFGGVVAAPVGAVSGDPFVNVPGDDPITTIDEVNAVAAQWGLDPEEAYHDMDSPRART